MGTFLALTSVIGKSHNQVVEALTKYTRLVHGGLEQKESINPDMHNCCIIKEMKVNTSVFYPDGYLEWDDSSQFISKELNATVFSFHIHDGDLWMYILFNNGEIVDQFNPIPNYWESNISENEIDKWKGDVDNIVKYIPNTDPNIIKNYLVRWNLVSEKEVRAYPDDEFAQEDWQMTDFMTKLHLPYPIDDYGNPDGTTYNIWTKQLKQPIFAKTAASKNEKFKAWWKFW